MRLTASCFLISVFGFSTIVRGEQPLLSSPELVAVPPAIATAPAACAGHLRRPSHRRKNRPLGESRRAPGRGRYGRPGQTGAARGGRRCARRNKNRKLPIEC